MKDNAPTGFQQAMRDLGHKLPYTSLGKKLASLLLRLAGGTRPDGYDVTVFGDQDVRLYPHDNISEKRVYITPQFWDPEERALLADHIRAHGQKDFWFLDVGANAGLYSLFARSVCLAAGKRARIVAVEPDPLMRARLIHNFASAGGKAKDAPATGESKGSASVLAWAITGESQTVYLHQNEKSRGMNTVSTDQTDGIAVEGHPLTDIFSASGAPRIDVMKMDIEGAEYPALKTFFETAEDWQLPGLIQIETSHEDAEQSALQLCLDAGYGIIFQNRLNTVLKKA